MGAEDEIREISQKDENENRLEALMKGHSQQWGTHALRKGHSQQGTQEIPSEHDLVGEVRRIDLSNYALGTEVDLGADGGGNILMPSNS